MYTIASTTDTNTRLAALDNLQAQGKLHYKTYSRDWIVKFWNDQRAHFMIGYSFDINSQAAAQIAGDKVATYVLLDEAHIATVPHILLTSPDAPMVDQQQLASLFQTYQVLVIKPTHGGHGEDAYLCRDMAQTARVLSRQDVPSWTAAPYIDIETEIRLVVHKGIVKLVYRKDEPVEVNDLRMFNLGHGAQATYINLPDVDQHVRDMAQQAMSTIGLSLGAVDIILDRQSIPRVLEINSGFSIEHFAHTSPENRRRAIDFYEDAITDSLQ
jgi:glutathione synthase/RimK-type ligase-like ATP-grasp enzyme